MVVENFEIYISQIVRMAWCWNHIVGKRWEKVGNKLGKNWKKIGKNVGKKVGKKLEKSWKKVGKCWENGHVSAF